MNKYEIEGRELNSGELKELVVSRRLKIDRAVYQTLGKDYRIYPNALTCNCMKLPDETIVMAIDLGFHLSTLSSMFSWNNLELLKYMGDMTTPFIIKLDNNIPTLYHNKDKVCEVTFLPKTEFFK